MTNGGRLVTGLAVALTGWRPDELKCTESGARAFGTKFVIATVMSKFELHPGEQILREERASYFKSRLNLRAGKLVVTSQRVVFCARPRWAYGFGVIGMLLAKPNRVDIELPSPNITDGREDEKGFLALAMADREFRFAVASPCSDWLAVISPGQDGPSPTGAAN